MTRQRIAILGATGHVGKCLIDGLSSGSRWDVTAVARNSDRLDAFLQTLPNGSAVARSSFDGFADEDYDVVVNGVGVGNPADVASMGAQIFEVTSHFDDVVMDYLQQHPASRLISFSSGAAYCGDFAEPVSESTQASVPINAIGATDYYGLAKLQSEIRHRTAGHLAIVDLRLFGLFSRHIDLAARFFMSDVVTALTSESVLTVSHDDIVRDYVAPTDLVALVNSVATSDSTNDVYDIYSAAPVAKFDLLSEFASRYGLRYDVAESPSTSATGTKPNYYSMNRRAEAVGYAPQMTSLQAVVSEVDALLKNR